MTERRTRCAALLARGARATRLPVDVVLALCALLAVAAASAQQPISFLPSTAPFVATETTIPMRDGAALAADVYLPRDAGPGPWPEVLIQTPYDKAPMRPWFAGEGR